MNKLLINKFGELIANNNEVKNLLSANQSAKYYAHSENHLGKKHLLKDHLIQTSKIAGSFGRNNYERNVLRAAGLLHDLGKYQADFQKYLFEGGKRGSVPHAVYGSIIARGFCLSDTSIAIDGHHKGIPNSSDWNADTKEADENSDKLKDLFFQDIKISNEIFNLEKGAFHTRFERDLFIRFVYSSLTDADWLNTEAHFKPEKSKLRQNIKLNTALLIEKLDAHLAGKSKDGEINKLRNTAREAALKKASQSPGFFTLNLPTVMGKTLTSVYWALSHAKANNLKRIIIVLPFINIIDQTGEVLKNIFGTENILEHHSYVNEEYYKNSESDIYDFHKLACENWNYPIIITTTVQFFETLFSNKPSKCRKLHNIADSAVIFDEVQTLPKEVIKPTLDMLKNLNSVLNVSFLFCTATMPAFEKRDNFDGIENLTPLIEEPEKLFSKTIRINYNLINRLKEIDFAVLLKKVAKTNKSALIVMNTKKAALNFYQLACMEKHNWTQIYHLSTFMCPTHRKIIIKQIRNDLKNNQKILVCSTQLIEAGVDFDFPCVFRAVAPLESIIQSAGRCNREGILPYKGLMHIFRLKGSKMPDKTYKACAEHAAGMILDNTDELHKHDFFEDYYKQVINLYIDQGNWHSFNELRKSFSFKDVNNVYKIIDSPGQSIFIKDYNDDCRTLYNKIKSQLFIDKEDYRAIQQFSVSLYANQIKKYSDKISEMEQGLLIWLGEYDSNKGINLAPAEIDDFIV